MVWGQKKWSGSEKMVCQECGKYDGYTYFMMIIPIIDHSLNSSLSFASLLGEAREAYLVQCEISYFLACFYCTENHLLAPLFCQSNSLPKDLQPFPPPPLPILKSYGKFHI